MKIPKYLQAPCFAPAVVGYKHVARILEVEAKLSRKDGFREEARALELAADALKRIGPTTSPAQAFGWRLPPTQGEKP